MADGCAHGCYTLSQRTVTHGCAQGCSFLSQKTRDNAHYGYQSFEKALDKIPAQHWTQVSRVFNCVGRLWLVGDIASDISVVLAINRREYPNTFRTAIAFIVLPYAGLLLAFFVPLHRRRQQRTADHSCGPRDLAIACAYLFLGLPAMIIVDLSLAFRYSWVDFDNASSCELWPLGSTTSRDLLLLYERARRVTEALLESILQTSLQIYLFSEKEADQLTLAIALFFSVVSVLMMVVKLHWEARVKHKTFGQSLMGALLLGLGFDVAATQDYHAPEVSFQDEELTSDELERICDRAVESGKVVTLNLSRCRIPGSPSAFRTLSKNRACVCRQPYSTAETRAELHNRSQAERAYL